MNSYEYMIDWSVMIDYGPILKLFGKRETKYYVYAKYSNGHERLYGTFKSRNEADICTDRLDKIIDEEAKKHLIVCECGHKALRHEAIFDKVENIYICKDCFIK